MLQVNIVVKSLRRKPEVERVFGVSDELREQVVRPSRRVGGGIGIGMLLDDSKCDAEITEKKRLSGIYDAKYLGVTLASEFRVPLRVGVGAESRDADRY
jgi:hypothetical protein